MEAIVKEEETQDMDSNNITQEDVDTIFAVNRHNTINTDEPFMIDLRNKMAIVYNVLKACIREQAEGVYYYFDDIKSRMAFLTNFHHDVLPAIIHKAKEPESTLVYEESVLDTSNFDLLIRQTLIKYYVENSAIPRAETLKKVIGNHPYNYQIDQQLKISGYIWRRLPKTKRVIIIEHPKRVVERQRYLQQIIRHRKEKRPIVYIEARIFNKADKNILHWKHLLTEGSNYVMVFIANHNDKGFFGGHFFVCKSIFRCQKLLETHLIDNYLPKLREPSVILIEDKIFYTKSYPVPTIESNKCEMKNWLKVNGVPHEADLHRSELFELIEKCKYKNDLHKFDAVIQAHGHKVLRRPSRTDYLNYFKPIWKKLKTTSDVTRYISHRSLKFWGDLETSLIKMEEKVVSEDRAMENVIDKILTMANNIDVNEWANAECDEGSDSLEQDEIIIEHSNSSSQEELNEREQLFLIEISKYDCTSETSEEMKTEQDNLEGSSTVKMMCLPE